MKIPILIAFCFALSQLTRAMDPHESSTDEFSCSSEGSCTGSPLKVISQEDQEPHKRLQRAIKRGDQNAIGLFLAQGGNVEGISKSNKRTLLMHASQNDQAEMCKFLIDAKANVNAAHTYGTTPLMLASSAQISKILLAAGADVDAKDIYGDTALFKCDTNEQCQVLLQAGADVNVRNNCGATPIFRCAFLPGIESDPTMRKKQIIEQYRLLLEAGARINTKNDEGKTVLQMFLYSSDIRHFLLEHGADVNSQDNDGTTPLMEVSRTFTNFEIAQELLTVYHADMHIKNARGKTALLIAAALQQIKTCKFFVDHQKQLDLGIIVALGCIKKKGLRSLYARSLYHDRNDLLGPYMRPYATTHSLRSMLAVRTNKGKTAYDILYKQHDFLKPTSNQDSDDDRSPDMTAVLDFFNDDLPSASPLSMSDDQESSSELEEGSSGSVGNSDSSLLRSSSFEGQAGYEGE